MNMGPMNTIRKEVRDLISVNERIQSARTQGLQLTEDELGLIEMCTRELMSVSASQNFFARRDHRVKESGDGARVLESGDGSNL
jgi:hypothetical protein